MRIQQLQYLEKIAETGSMNEAAKQLFVSQPSLTQAIKELEKEYQIQLFYRSKTGMTLTNEGREFINYTRAILDQVNLLDTKYKSGTIRKQIFSVSAQHYAFVVHAFVELVKLVGGDEYDFTLRETMTQHTLDDVQSFKSEIGVIYLSHFNESVLKNLINEKELEFIPLFEAFPHVFVGRDNPLTQKERVTLEDLEEYPYLSYEQGDTNSYYFSEEILSTLYRKKHIQISDRATIFNLMVGLNGYTISSGIISSALNDEKIVAIPLDVDESMTLGYIKHKKISLSAMGQQYIELLKQNISDYGFNLL
ncbi:LysR family transcriptional regulator [Aerococcaceae bacterium zg-ZJ1578]|uniref:LysR family transcriptional regulator n=1 Tax=Aerococcaceae TaxID=186827 RepID=UPI0013B7DBA8|nr:MULTISPECIES: LysR family transcriptional regulator [unclassified Facklamia]MBK0347806.1 LysR family transcriptional regulator [Aerococcaceae bacterium zg-1578]MBR7927515.1 LysR family transcriptional regulator [Aerococcaceae bacterium zg-ZUI334]MBS4461340.1 LysR family transcriptional regulator [Aerococcaceae bacterium zg-B36]QQD65890.1 LysR family transcriptional regulator [Aerococcaceae bacterium zg-252]NEW64186.1 LysR family transcriptional regulator [Facklamia sp. 252]